MRNRCTLPTTCLLCLGLAACGSSSLLAPEGPRFDGGYTAGSGNRTQDTTTVTSELETTVDSDTTAERGGYTFGSGNKTEAEMMVDSDTTTERGGHGFGQETSCPPAEAERWRVVTVRQPYRNVVRTAGG